MTVDSEEAAGRALAWNDKEFGGQPMYIRRLNTNNQRDMEMLDLVIAGRSTVFRPSGTKPRQPSATVSQIGLMESHVRSRHRCRGGPPHVTDGWGGRPLR